ncbi:sigma 54-interacting transcriptional regulator [Chitinophaga sp. CF418]|uniref:sigma 54-interacting transcriptional regulator n=1 Tax=Chitinophaga sp. CF418 TaxID=1855287 RepID=UPI0009216898|nr:sigma 54-interacting transcriptional regulator [Chitinophaga sp. CF418]SHM85653.1 Transcriptional regulator containing GAF, AAA-type ATPase, and DNA-binding Fis domains [Chitinophaga sp. CF418]
MAKSTHKKTGQASDNEDALEKKIRQQEILLSLSAEIIRIKNKPGLMTMIRETLGQLFTFSHAMVTLITKDREQWKTFLLDSQSTDQHHKQYKDLITFTYPIQDGIYNKVLETEGSVVFDLDELVATGSAPSHIVVQHETGIKEMAAITLICDNIQLGVLSFYAKTHGAFTRDARDIIEQIVGQVSLAVANVQQMEEINRYKQQLEEENHYFREANTTGYTYSDIIGTSEAMQKMFHLLGQVAYANSTVLILGETGTGKELVARAIHNSSPRKDKLMVKVNCAAMPASLIESELFGHEKGSFTGATERRIGKFELASKGTLFLDEIGEMPVDLQVKLLRALQEKEIERIGGKGPIKVDVRIIVATNRNLKKEVAEGRFREDLFYRLNVFPITLPPLRERKEDIPALANHFIGKYSRNAGRKEMSISSKAMKELMSYNWPGNVRELEHLLERSVLLTSGNVIKEIDLPVIYKNTVKEEKDYTKTLAEMEREYIIEVLKRCNGKVFGPGGAAAILGLRVSTLNSRIKKLGIKKETLIS